jgi:signal transduction histidine kinase/ActR/RegA family two-component response regulator
LAREGEVRSSRTPVDRPLLGLIIGFAIIVAMVATSIWLLDSQRRATGMVTHSFVVEQRLSSVLANLQDAETGQRGYLLTGRTEFLEPYDSSIANLGREFIQLHQLLADNPEQQASLTRLQASAEQRQDVLVQTIAEFRQGRGLDLAKLQRGKRLMDDIRLQVAGMKTEEQELLLARNGAVRLRTSGLAAALALSVLAIIALGVFAFGRGRRQQSATLAANRSLADANQQLIIEAETRQAAELQVNQLQKMEAVGKLTGGIAHDFNNMLTIVIGSLETAKRRAGDAKRVATCIDNAMEGATRAAQLTARLLAFSRQQPLEPRTVDANKLVGGMSELLRRTIGEHLRIETVLAGGLWPALVDPVQLENAILNLCVNARDAMPGGGRLTIETANAHLDDEYARGNAEAAAGQFVLISVTDTGTGMPQEVIDRAFDPFFSTKGVGQGTGLGLSQVHGFVKQTGGHVKIYSEPGVGTTIKLYLPRHFGGAAATAAPQSVSDIPQARDHEVVLVVEDEDQVRHLAVEHLRELGYTVVQAADASQALAVLTLQPKVDLLFTDIIMPDVNGRELAERCLRERPSLKVLYTTGYTRNAIVHNGMLDPGVAFLPKPFTLETLARKVRQVLDGPITPSGSD